MKENQRGDDRHLDLSSEANREKHINFPGQEQESSVKRTGLLKTTIQPYLRIAMIPSEYYNPG